jgi:hypothetical protein
MTEEVMKLVSTEPFAGCEEYTARLWIRKKDGYCAQVERFYFSSGKNAHKSVHQYIERHTPDLVRVVTISYV